MPILEQRSNCDHKPFQHYWTTSVKNITKNIIFYLPWKTIIFTAETNTTTRTIRKLGHKSCFKTNSFMSDLESLLLQVVCQKSIGFVFSVAELGVIVNLSNGTLAWFIVWNGTRDNITPEDWFDATHGQGRWLCYQWRFQQWRSLGKWRRKGKRSAWELKQILEIGVFNSRCVGQFQVTVGHDFNACMSWILLSSSIGFKYILDGLIDTALHSYTCYCLPWRSCNNIYEWQMVDLVWWWYRKLNPGHSVLSFVGQS